MMTAVVDDRAQYRLLIDALVRSCREGQGQIGAERARQGIWNRNAAGRPDEMPDQLGFSDLLERLAQSDREVLARMLAEAFASGVHETLVVLHEAGVPPFEDGYEGAPFNDFVGRMQGWAWPNDA